MGSVSIISSNTSSSSPSEELELRTGAVVIDTGTRSCKAGFSGQQISIAKINTLVGCPTAWPPGPGKDRSEAFIGEEALLYPNTEIEPMQNCIIISWEVAETLWQHLFDHKLQVPPKEYALLITEPLLSCTTHQEKMVEVAFKSLGSPGLFVAYQPVLSTYAHGRTSSLVVEVGYAVSQPVHEGYSSAHATETMDLVGSCLSWYLMTLLGDMLSNKMAHIMEDIKHKCCYIASNFESKCQLLPVSCALDFPLPMARPSASARRGVNSQKRSSTLCQSGVFPMRASMRLPEEASTNFQKKSGQQCTKVGVAAMPLWRYSAWTGASILTSLKNFQTWWIQRDEYDGGPCIIHQRCY
ncbi:LOW QUALITY PROTEIN: actin-like protein 9 [Sarcoramphus papa]